MKNLTIIRHAKSSWEFPQDDFKRDLIQKGVYNSYKVAKASSHLVTKNSIVFISPAIRAEHTAAIFLEQWKIKFDKVEIKNSLYTFTLNQLEEIVKSCSNEYNNLILFGHNGAITDFVNKFGTVFIENVPTSGFVSITFETNEWKLISKGKTNHIIFPSHI